MKPDVCLISEFGEEMKGHRIEIANIYTEAFKQTKAVKNTIFLPADIGAKVDLEKHQIKAINKISEDEQKCTQEWVNPKRVKCFLMKKDSSIHYYVENSDFQASDMVQAKIEEFYKHNR